MQPDWCYRTTMKLPCTQPCFLLHIMPAWEWPNTVSLTMINMSYNMTKYPWDKKTNNVRSIIVDFRSFKHSNHEGAMLEISSQRDTSCPVSLLSKYMYIRPKINGPIFVNQSGKAITRLQFQAVFHRCISFLSLDTTRYNTRSLRIGGCTDMMTQGYSDSQIKAVGRWKSDAFKRYIRPTIVSL